MLSLDAHRIGDINEIATQMQTQYNAEDVHQQCRAEIRKLMGDDEDLSHRRGLIAPRERQEVRLLHR